MTNFFRVITMGILFLSSSSVFAECMDPQAYAKYSKICDQQNAADENLRKQVEYECASAGDINRCISIRLQGRIDPSRNLQGVCAKVVLAGMDFSEDKAYGRAPGTTCKKNLQTPPFDSSGKSTGQKQWGTSDPYQNLPSIGDVKLR